MLQGCSSVYDAGCFFKYWKWKISNRRILKLLTIGVIMNIIIVILVNFGFLKSEEDGHFSPPHFVKEQIHRPKKWVVAPNISDVTEIEEMCFIIQRRLNNWMVLVFSSTDASLVRCTKGNMKFYKIEDAHFKRWLGKSPYRVGDSLGRTKAYITAIMSGADYIYVANNLTDMISLEQSPFSTTRMYNGLTYAGSNDNFDPYAHFGCTESNSGMETRYRLCTSAIPVLQANIILKISSPKKNVIVPNVCLEGAPPVVMKRSVDPLPLDLNNALYKKEMFWALPIMPFTNDGERAIWAYFVQACLAEIGHHIQLNTVAERRVIANANSNLIDHADAVSIRKIIKASNLKTLGLVDTYRVILAKMIVNKFVSLEKVKELTSWMNLSSKMVGNIDRWHNAQPMTCPHSLMYRPWLRQNEETDAEPLSSDRIQNINIVRNTYNKFCSNNKMHGYEIGKETTRQFPKIALVVVYDGPQDDIIPFVETLYRPHFPIIVHCSPRISERMSRHRFGQFSKRGWKYIFVEYKYNGSLSYECVRLVTQLRLPVDGYLFIANDVIFSPHDIPKFSTNTPWISEPSGQCPTKKVGGHCERWIPGRENTERMKRVYEFFNDNASPITYACSKTLEKITGKPNWFINGRSDVYYLPVSLALAMDAFLEVYIANRIDVEIAIPNLVHCLWNGQIQKLRGLDVSDKLREHFNVSFDKMKSQNYTFLHPAKWRYVGNRLSHNLKVYCNEVVPFFHKMNISHVLETKKQVFESFEKYEDEDEDGDEEYRKK